MTITHIIL